MGSCCVRFSSMPVGDCADTVPQPGVQTATTRVTFAAVDYDLEATLNSGQAFRWQRVETGWVGVIGSHWVRLESKGAAIEAQVAIPLSDWAWLRHYLQLDLDFAEVLKTFPQDAPMREALAHCRGLRLLRQDPWECLASFIVSSTKQIVQIRHIISLLSQRYGAPVAVPPGYPPARTFPSADRLAALTEEQLRDCKMGFRAPYLLATAQEVAGGFELSKLQALPVEAARQRLLELPGVGRKIADCVLLFAYGFPTAFPVDVWVMKALRQLYFRGRRIKAPRLHRFAVRHFGPHSGYAQQYLFHYMRTRRKLPGHNAAARQGGPKTRGQR